jgi:branched-chain amino acid transport system substrate-binding protein
MVGKSAYSFYRAWHQACQQQPWLNEVLKLSLTLCEPEVQLIGAEALEGIWSLQAGFSRLTAAPIGAF